MRDASLTAAERAWDSASSSLNSGEEGIENSLTSGQWVDWSELLGDGSWCTDGPEMRHADVLLLAVGELDDGYAIGDCVLAFGHNLNDRTIALGWSHNDMLMEKVIFENVTDLITASDDGTRSLIVVRHEGVLTILVE